MGVLPLWAVHVSDGVLSWPWLLGGALGALALAVLAAVRVRDEEIPRIALMTAAFFVASSIHVKLGPSSTHLLLNGLVGIVLGWRAPLAILVGVALQALLIPHGGLWTIGVNTCTEAIPALFAAGGFSLLRRAPWARAGFFRGAMVGLSAAVWAACLVFGVVVLCTNPLGGLGAHVSRQAGLVLSALEVRPALEVTFHPLTQELIALFAVLCAWGESRMGNAPEFPLGLLVGLLTVLMTTALTGTVLLLDGKDTWRGVVTILYLSHLPLAALEGLILGCTVGFLARVKPEMLGEVHVAPPCATTVPAARSHPTPAPPTAETAVAQSMRPALPPVLLLAVGALLLSASPARAHRLMAEYYPSPATQTVRIEAWFETGDAPRQATVEVFREGGELVTKGPLDEKGNFVFRYDRPGPLRVVILAPGGHRAECLVPASALPARSDVGDLKKLRAELEETREELRQVRAEQGQDRLRDLAVGVSFVLALAAFAMAVRRGRPECTREPARAAHSHKPLDIPTGPR